MTDHNYHVALTNYVNRLLQLPASQARLATGQGVAVYDRANSPTWHTHEPAVVAAFRAAGWQVVDDPSRADAWLFYGRVGK